MSGAVRIRGGVVAVPIAALTPDQIREDAARLSVANPARVQADRRADPRAFAIPARVSSLVVEDDHVLYPIGAPGVCRPRCMGLRVVDDRPTFAAKPLPYRGELLTFQRKALDALLSNTTGVLVAPCGSGKGEKIVAAIGELGLPTLVLCMQMDQAVELRSRVTSRLGVPCGLIGGGERQVERITVALVQALDDKAIAEIAPLFEVVIVDEAHHAAAESYRRLLSRLGARRFYGFTATIDRVDGLTAFVHHHLGPVRYAVTRAQLVEAGRSVTPRYVQVETAFAFEYADRRDWAPLLDALAEDVARDEQIVELVLEHGAGELSAVLLGRVEHAERLADRLRGRGLRAVALTGQKKKAERAQILTDAREGRLDVIVGTQLLDEGIDVARLSRVVLAWPSKAEGRLIQRIGRALRMHETKAAPLVLDLVDVNVGPLKWQARARRAAFERNFAAISEAA